MTLVEQLRDIKTQLRMAMNGVASQSMREKGLVYKLNFGVEYPRLKEIAMGYAPDHTLAQTLWKENVRESKILATLIMPTDDFVPELADIWVEDVPNTEIAEFACMNLFQNLSYAPAKALQWIASEQEMTQICGYLTIARLLMKKGDMADRVENEFLDQVVVAFLSGSHALQNACATAIRKYMQHSQEHAFTMCRMVEGFKDSEEKEKSLLYAIVAEEAAAY